MKLPSDEILKLIRYEEVANGQRWLVGGVGGRRSGEVGECIGILALRHAEGYEVVLKFPDGKIDSFAPLALFPAPQTPQPLGVGARVRVKQGQIRLGGNKYRGRVGEVKRINMLGKDEHGGLWYVLLEPRGRAGERMECIWGEELEVLEASVPQL